MLTKNFEELRVCVAINNITSDAYNISSLADGEDYREYMKSKYGIPEILTPTLESFFCELQPSEAIQFFTSLLDSIACDGKDLSKVIWKFLALELRQLSGVNSKIETVIEGMDLLSEGKPWPDAARVALAFSYSNDADVRASYAAVYAASYFDADATASSADAASYAVDSAAHAVDAAAYAPFNVARLTESYKSCRERQRQRATLLKLIAEAPVHAH